MLKLLKRTELIDLLDQELYHAIHEEEQRKKLKKLIVAEEAKEEKEEVSKPSMLNFLTTWVRKRGETKNVTPAGSSNDNPMISPIRKHHELLKGSMHAEEEALFVSNE